MYHIPMNQTISSITKNLVNLLYPLRCASCGKDLDAAHKTLVCDPCAGAIRYNPKPHCAVCGRSVSDARKPCPECNKTRYHFERAYAACLYDDGLKELIHAFKYKQKIGLAGLFTNRMIDFIKENDEVIQDVDLVTFVPLHGRRLWERAFNQSKVLASAVSRSFGIRLVDTLDKTESTKPQNMLSRKERLTNLADAFRAKDPAPLKDMRVLLIDDVMTTGATFNECSRVLKEAGAARVRCLALARGT